MNKFDACKILGLTGDITLDEVKKSYRLACAKYHPDKNPAGLEMMKAVNVAYDCLKTLFDTESGFNFDNKNINYGDLLNDAINSVIHCEGVIIEVCGAWVWLSGETKTFKDQIKEAGYMWAAKKKMWYFRPNDYKSFNRGTWDMEKIRTAYGSAAVEKKEQIKLSA